MANQEEFNDVTEERDVTDAVIEHDVTAADEIPEEEEVTIDPNQLKFVSMDGRVYLADRDAIDWDATSSAESVQNLEQNLFIARQMLREAMFSRHEKGDIPIVHTIHDVVKPYLSDFGYTPDYMGTYPDATQIDMAIMYCIDIIEVLNVVLREVAILNAIKQVETSETDKTE